MKICFVTHNFTAAPGGAERQLALIANCLARAGHTVSIVVHERARAPIPYPLAEGIEFVNIRPAPQARGRLRRGLVDPARRFTERACKRVGLHRLYPVGLLLWLDAHEPFRRRLQAYLARARPDVAIAFMDTAVIALARSEPGYALRRVGANRNNPQLSYDTRSGERANPVHYRANRAALHRLDRIVTQLDDFVSWYPPDLAPRVTVIPNIIETPQQAQGGAAREKTAIAAGRLVPLKRVDVLVEAWAQVAAQAPDWTLEIYGTGPCAARLDRAIAAHGLQDRILLKGHVDDIYDRYARAALLIHPSEGEGFPNVVAEALVRGMPVLGFADCAGLNGLVRHEENGWLAPAEPDRVTALAQVLGGVLAQPGRLAAMEPRCVESMRAYSAPRVVEKWEHMLHELAACAPEAR